MGSFISGTGRLKSRLSEVQHEGWSSCGDIVNKPRLRIQVLREIIRLYWYPFRVKFTSGFQLSQVNDKDWGLPGFRGSNN
jgi:hypothetical protein